MNDLQNIGIGAKRLLMCHESCAAMSSQTYFHCLSRNPKGERVTLELRDKGHFPIHFWILESVLDGIANHLIRLVIVNHEDCFLS